MEDGFVSGQAKRAQCSPTHLTVDTSTHAFVSGQAERAQSSSTHLTVETVERQAERAQLISNPGEEREEREVREEREEREERELRGSGLGEGAQLPPSSSTQQQLS